MIWEISWQRIRLFGIKFDVVDLFVAKILSNWQLFFVSKKVIFLQSESNIVFAEINFKVFLEIGNNVFLSISNAQMWISCVLLQLYRKLCLYRKQKFCLGYYTSSLFPAMFFCMYERKTFEPNQELFDIIAANCVRNFIFCAFTFQKISWKHYNV